MPQEQETQSTPSATRRGLDRDERNDLSDALEHLVAVGCSYRQAHGLRQAYHGKRKHGPVHDGLDGVAPSEPSRKKQAKQKEEPDDETVVKAVAHAEDVRLYGHNGFPAPPWPRQRTRGHFRPISDDQWQVEHGDGIGANEFCRLKRSLHPPSTRAELVESKVLTSSQRPETSLTVPLDQVPRDLLLRCWDRAVDAVSNVIHIDTTQATTTGPLPPDAASDIVQHHQQQANNTTTAAVEEGSVEAALYYSEARARSKCENFQIHVSKEPPFSCLTCQVEFDSMERLEQHFYGQQQHVRGCCWALIEKAQRALVDRTLQTEVKRQARQLVQLVLSKSDPSKVAKKGEGHDGMNNLFDWEHIMRVLQKTMHETREQHNNSGLSLVEAPGRVVEQTLQLVTESPPLALNRTVLEAISSRLIDRYGKVNM